MSAQFNPKKEKVKAGNKSLYISDELAEKVSNLAKEYDTSFNNIVISILTDFFENQDNDNK